MDRNGGTHRPVFSDCSGVGLDEGLSIVDGLGDLPSTH